MSYDDVQFSHLNQKFTKNMAHPQLPLFSKLKMVCVIHSPDTREHFRRWHTI